VLISTIFSLPAPIKWQECESVVKIRFDGLKKVATYPRFRTKQKTPDEECLKEKIDDHNTEKDVISTPPDFEFEIPGEVNGFQVQRTDMNDLIRIDPPADVSIESISKGYFKSITIESPYAVGITAPTFGALCEFGSECTNDIMSTFAAVCHKIMKNVEDTVVIPFAVHGGNESTITILKQFVVDTNKKAYMLALDGFKDDEGKDKNHWTFVEILKETKTIVLRDRYGRDVKDSENKDERWKCLLRGCLWDIGWIGVDDHVKSLAVETHVDESVWKFSFEQESYHDEGDDQDCGPVATLLMIHYLLGKEWFPIKTNKIHLTVRTMACLGLCKGLTMFWDDISWLDDNILVTQLIKEFAISTCLATINPEYDLFHINCDQCCYCKSHKDNMTSLFCMHCCGSYHVECFLRVVKDCEGTKEHCGKFYACFYCEEPLLKLAIVKEHFLWISCFSTNYFGH